MTTQLLHRPVTAAVPSSRGPATWPRRAAVGALAGTSFLGAVGGAVPASVGLVGVGLALRAWRPAAADRGLLVAWSRRNAVIGAVGLLLAATLAVAAADLPGASGGLVAAALMALPLSLHRRPASGTSRVTATPRTMVLVATAAGAGIYSNLDGALWRDVPVAVVVAAAVGLVARARHRGRLGQGCTDGAAHRARALLAVALLAVAAGLAHAGMFAGWGLQAGGPGPYLGTFAAASLVLVGLTATSRRPVDVVALAAAGVATLLLTVELVQVHHTPADVVALELPVPGPLTVIQGGHSQLLNAHDRYGFEHDALDLARTLNQSTLRPGGDPAVNDDHLIFDEPVVAPGAGTVVTVVDHYTDTPLSSPEVADAAGNHVVIDMGHGRYILLAHLRAGSIVASAGQQVQPGDRVGRVGNSGNSSEPHLHLQVQDTPTVDADAHTTPIVFRSATLARNGRKTSPVTIDARRGDRLEPTAAIAAD